jgi:diguanylate cyclase (GGDEF)-like protein
MDFLVDGDGNLYTEQSASAFMAENAPDVPIFRVSSTNICNGVLGGVVYSHYDAGLRTGEMAVSILQGTKPAEIPLVYTPFNTVVFEQEAMDHFGIKRSDLPEGTNILNEDWSFSRFYEENQLLTHMILLVIVLLITLIVGLWRGIKHREKMANQDFLTKMPNRLYINSRIQKQIERREPFGIMMMDVDYFKSINDTMGHAVGDELLVEVAKRLKAIAHKDLIFARIGGDEFIGLSTGTKVEEGEKICQKVLESIRKDCHLSCGIVNVTASIGYAAFPLHTDNPDKVMNYADAALYEVKEMGRNGYQIFREELLKNLEK